MSVRLALIVAVLATQAACLSEIDGGCDGCGDPYAVDDEDFSILPVGEPIYLCPAGVMDARCPGGGAPGIPLASETRTQTGGDSTVVQVEDLRILAPSDRRLRVHDVRMATSLDAAPGFELRFRPDGGVSDGWLSITPDLHDWHEVTTAVAADGVHLDGTVACRGAACIDGVGQGYYQGAVPTVAGQLYEYQLWLYPVRGAADTGYDIAFTVE